MGGAGIAAVDGQATLTPGEVLLCTGTYIATQPDVVAGRVTNTAAVTATLPSAADGLGDAAHPVLAVSGSQGPAAMGPRGV